MGTPKQEILRPHPPEALFDDVFARFIPAPEVVGWIRNTFMDEASRLYNEEHVHLKDAHLAALWTNEMHVKQGNRVAGTAEIPAFRCGGWERARQQMQMRDWFGDIPQFLITLDGNYAREASDAQFCALVEHELYHCGQAKDDFGQPAFTKDGRPKFTMRGHDVEEFVGIVKRYGAGNAAGATAKLVEAAKLPPVVANLDIARACGTCMLKAA